MKTKRNEKSELEAMLTTECRKVLDVYMEELKKTAAADARFAYEKIVFAIKEAFNERKVDASTFGLVAKVIQEDLSNGKTVVLPEAFVEHFLRNRVRIAIAQVASTTK